jgi:acyl carrier protein
MSAVADEVIKIIAHRFGEDEAAITNETDITNDLGADSLDIAELLIEFEEKLSVSIDESEVQGLVTVGDVIAYVEKFSNSPDKEQGKTE